MDEDEIYRRLSALKDRQDAKLPTSSAAANQTFFKDVDFRVAYELAIRSTRAPHVKDEHEHVPPELVLALGGLEPARAVWLLQARRMKLPAKIALGDAPSSDDGSFSIRNVVVVASNARVDESPVVIVRPCESSMGSLALRVLRKECSKRAGAADVCDYLLRVYFRSRDVKHRPRSDRDLRSASSVLKGGLEVAGKRFLFLAYTDTQLKNASAWFIRTDAPITRAEILGRGDGGGGLLGDFHGLSPGKWAARVRQCFSETREGCSGDWVLSDSGGTWDVIADIVRNEFNFTDGAGTISRGLMCDVARRL